MALLYKPAPVTQSILACKQNRHTKWNFDYCKVHILEIIMLERIMLLQKPQESEYVRAQIVFSDFMKMNHTHVCQIV